MQFPLIARRVNSVVILLNFTKQYSAAYRMHGACRYEKTVSLLYLYEIEQRRHRPVFKRLFKFLFGHRLFKSAIHSAPFLGVDDIPHLRLAVFSFVFQRVFIVGMNLYGQIILAVNKFYKYWKERKLPCLFPKKLGIFFQHARQSARGKLSVDNDAFALFVT